MYKNLVEFILQSYFISYTKIGSQNKIPNPSPIAGRENHGQLLQCSKKVISIRQHGGEKGAFSPRFPYDKQEFLFISGEVVILRCEGGKVSLNVYSYPF